MFKTAKIKARYPECIIKHGRNWGKNDYKLVMLSHLRHCSNKTFFLILNKKILSYCINQSQM